MDEDGIRVLFRNLEDAWAKKDAAAFARQFHPDAVFINIMADRFVGPALIEKQHRAIFDTIYAGTRVEFEVGGVRPLADGVAAVEARGRVTREGVQLVVSHALAIAVRRAEAWRLDTFHNMIPFKPPT